MAILKVNMEEMIEIDDWIQTSGLNNSFVPLETMHHFFKNGGLVEFEETSLYEQQTNSYILCEEGERMLMYESLPEDPAYAESWKEYLETGDPKNIRTSSVALHFYSLKDKSKYVYYLYVSSVNGVLPFRFKIIN